ncbi:zinc-binding alcohol dehydrogenase [Muricauda sp. JGD-17]|uniref:Zinc-binding alcohol dehydrogenase n=1 Tax=Flagellimonas ochracea TaxID=2696472 RepID=A0A964T8V2_9FLAO|nr:zinc-binding alcohol dehydrogenase [Allomuricauda ochracea]NAY90380.1 zinc-binding alcohol dehydrogenase [Allomuricauda ochracea]
MKVKEIPVSLFHQIRLSSKSKGSLKRNKKRVPVIVSLASIPSRLDVVHLTIRSILDQDVLPEKIFLWLHEDLRTKIPKKLSSLIGDIFEIKYTKYSSSHRKLVEPLKLFPKKIIITCDDDMMYPKDWLPKLHESHLKNPNCVVANQTRCISYSESGDLLSYNQWLSKSKSCKNPWATLPIGAGGTLYPPGVMNEQVFDQQLFLRLAPKADDLWFKAMTLLTETLSKQAKSSKKEPIPILGSQKTSLKKTNIKEDKNRTQWLALTDYFQLKLQKY